MAYPSLTPSPVPFLIPSYLPCSPVPSPTIPVSPRHGYANVKWYWKCKLCKWQATFHNDVSCMEVICQTCTEGSLRCNVDEPRWFKYQSMGQLYCINFVLCVWHSPVNLSHIFLWSSVWFSEASMKLIFKNQLMLLCQYNLAKPIARVIDSGEYQSYWSPSMVDLQGAQMSPYPF